MSRRIYIETTIPSFYFEVRPEPEMVARRNWTRDWWAVASSREEIVTSEAVLEELGAVGISRMRTNFDHIRRVNGILGLFVPSLVAPLELLGEEDGEED